MVYSSQIWPSLTFLVKKKKNCIGKVFSSFYSFLLWESLGFFFFSVLMCLIDLYQIGVFKLFFLLLICECLGNSRSGSKHREIDLCILWISFLALFCMSENQDCQKRMYLILLKKKEGKSEVNIFLSVFWPIKRLIQAWYKLFYQCPFVALVNNLRACLCNWSQLELTDSGVSPLNLCSFYHSHNQTASWSVRGENLTCWEWLGPSVQKGGCFLRHSTACWFGTRQRAMPLKFITFVDRSTTCAQLKI